MKITVLSRLDAERYTQKSPWVHISIGDPLLGVRRPRRACPRKSDVLYLQFLDATSGEIESDPERGEIAPFLFGWLAALEHCQDAQAAVEGGDGVFFHRRLPDGAGEGGRSRRTPGVIQSC